MAYSLSVFLLIYKCAQGSKIKSRSGEKLDEKSSKLGKVKKTLPASKQNKGNRGQDEDINKNLKKLLISPTTN